MYDFHINNNMFDESQLWLKTRPGGGRSHRKMRHRVLAAASQVTRRAPRGITEDIDVLRPPVVMERYTAATCASVLGDPDDIVGFFPKARAAPRAKYLASVTATDSHAVNKLVSKWIAAGQGSEDGTRFHIASYCTQHKTGNAVQQVTEYLGLIGPGFALASCLATSDISGSLDVELRRVLDEELDVVSPADILFDAPDETQHHALLVQVFEQCYVQASGQAAVSSSVHDQERKRRV